MVTESRVTSGNNNGNGNSARDDLPFPPWTPRQVFAATLVVLLVIFGFWVLIHFRVAVFSLFEAIVFGTALRPVVDGLQKKGIPRAISAAALFLLIFALMIGFVLLFIPLFTQQGATIGTTLSSYYANFRGTLATMPSILIHRLVQNLPPTLTITSPGPAPATAAQPLDRAAVVLSYGQVALHATFTTIITLLLTYYWTTDRDRILRSVLIFMPAARREPTRDFVEASENKVGAYLRGLAIMCSTIGILSGIAYLIIGLPYAPMLAVMAGLMEAVPLLGPVLGAIPAVLIALALDPTRVVWVIVATVVIQQFENHVLVPRVMDQAVGVNPVVSLLAFVIFSSLFGLPGALLAVPLAATIQLIFNRTLFVVPEPPPAGRNTLSVLRYEAQELVQDVRKQVRQKETTIDDPSDQVDDAIEAIVNDLDSILAQAEQDEIDGQAVVERGQA